MRAPKDVFYIVLSYALLAAGPVTSGPQSLCRILGAAKGRGIIRSYLIGKRKTGPDQFKVVYSNVDSDQGRSLTSRASAAVDCKNNSVSEDGGAMTINPDDKDASMATITAQNLWWLVCRGVQAKYRPHMPGLD